MKPIKILAAAIALIAIASPMAATAQNGTITPYSRYGYGILRDNATAAQTQMGGVGYAMTSGRQINVMNPASYAAVDSLTFLFDMGVTLSNVWQSELQGSQRATGKDVGAGLDYITMLFPVAKWMGCSVGLLPFSSVGYSFGSEIKNGSTSRQGSGSLNQLYLGVGIEPLRGLNIGANVSYLFGSTVNDTYAYISANTANPALYQRQLSVRDWHLDLGLQYTLRLAPRHRVTLGAVYSPAKDLHGHVRTYQYRVDSESSTTPDATDNIDMRGLYSLPETWGGGISYQWAGRLTAEADFTWQPWSKAKYQSVDISDITRQLADRWRVALGMQYQPNIRGGYFQRIQYRAGAYLSRDYLVVRDNNLREYGVNLGLGFPVPGYKSIVSLGIGWKHRQAYPQSLIKEDYLNITLGINFNEMWFRKSRIY